MNICAIMCIYTHAFDQAWVYEMLVSGSCMNAIM